MHNQNLARGNCLLLQSLALLLTLIFSSQRTSSRRYSPHCSWLSHVSSSWEDIASSNLGLAGARSGDICFPGVGSRSTKCLWWGDARSRDRPPNLAPAKPPLACPLPPTGGDALNIGEENKSSQGSSNTIGRCQLDNINHIIYSLPHTV